VSGGVQPHQQAEERDKSHIPLIAARGARFCSTGIPWVGVTPRAGRLLLAVTQIARTNADTVRGPQRVPTERARRQRGAAAGRRYE
jgi:hypothetical protein